MAEDVIRMLDVQAQRKSLDGDVEAAIARVLEHGVFVMGPEVAELETCLAQYADVPHVVSCSSGTDALLLVLMAWDVGPGDAVFVPSFTFAATAEAVALTGATPVFVDVGRTTFTIEPEHLDAAIRGVPAGLRPRAAIPVDLFGVPAAHKEIETVCAAHGVAVLSDAAQSAGARLSGASVLSFGAAAATSFFPAKPLGCYGDGGAVWTADAELAERMRSLRVHGQGIDKYDNSRVGLNARLDTLQAAVLLAKLPSLDDEIAARGRLADRYRSAFEGLLLMQDVPTDARPAWAQFTVVTESRDRLCDVLRSDGVPTAVYYPRPLHRQPAYAAFPQSPSGLANSDWLAQRVLSLPVHPFLTADQQERVIGSVLAAVG